MKNTKQMISIYHKIQSPSKCKSILQSLTKFFYKRENNENNLKSFYKAFYKFNLKLNNNRSFFLFWIFIQSIPLKQNHTHCVLLNFFFFFFKK